MALFKIYSGTADEFPSNYALHPGYAYFFEDSGELVIDTNNGRIDVKVSQLIKTVNGEVTFVDVDDVLTAADDNGLTKNAILVGGENNTVRAIAIAAGSVVIGDVTNGVKGINGTGALYATTSGAPSFGTLPLSAGGTGATTAAAARTNLDVYSKNEVITKVNEVTCLAYYTTLHASNWTQSTDGTYYFQNYDGTSNNLSFGKNGDVPPIIMCIINPFDYDKIFDASTLPNQKVIQFKSREQISGNIQIAIITLGGSNTTPVDGDNLSYG